MQTVMRTIYIMWLREMKRFFRSPARIIGALGQPLIFLISFGFGFGQLFKAAGQGDYIQFLAPGIIGMSIIFGAIFNGLTIIMDRQFGFLKETLVAPVPRIGIMLGRTLGGATTACLQGCIVLVMTLFVGLHPQNWALVPAALGVMLVIGALFSALGCMFGSILRDMQGFQLIMVFLVMPLFYLSGAMFPLKDVPRALQVVAALDPLSYGVDGLRTLLTGSTHFGLAVDGTVLASVTAVFLALGSYFFSRIEA